MVTGLPVSEISDQWRPSVVAQVMPRVEFAGRFRLEERQEVIEAERARSAMVASA